MTWETTERVIHLCGIWSGWHEIKEGGALVPLVLGPKIGEPKQGDRWREKEKKKNNNNVRERERG